MSELYDATGARKYLTDEERTAFLRQAEKAPREVRTFCGLLHYTGCRISEALELTADRIDRAAGVVVFESLKKRRKGVYRAVPIPPAFLDALDLVLGLREAQKRSDKGRLFHPPMGLGQNDRLAAGTGSHGPSRGTVTPGDWDPRPVPSRS
jgi:integrase